MEAFGGMVRFIHDIASDIALAITWVLEKLIPIINELEDNINELDEAKKTNQVSRAVDTSLGTILTVGIVFGIPANFICCYFFSTHKRMNENGIFYKRIYTLTSLLLLTICILLFPIIQVLLEGRQHESLLFYDNIFCNVWYAVWLVCYQTALFMIALMVLSGFVFSYFPDIKAKASTAWVLPGIVAGMIIIFVIMIPLARGKAIIGYKPVYSSCQIQGYPLDMDELEEIWEEFKEIWNEDVQKGNHPRIFGNNTKTDGPLKTGAPRDVTVTPGVHPSPDRTGPLISNRSEAKRIYEMCEEVANHVEEAFLNQRDIFLTRTSLLGMPILLIFISFVLCWVFSHVVRRQAESQLTVIRNGQMTNTTSVVTLVCVIFHVPAIIFSIYLINSYEQNISLMRSFFEKVDAALAYAQDFADQDVGESRKNKLFPNLNFDSIPSLDWDTQAEKLVNALEFVNDWVADWTDLVRNEGMFATISFIFLPILFSCLFPYLVYRTHIPFRDFIKNGLKNSAPETMIKTRYKAI